jgi:hypothetical protein
LVNSTNNADDASGVYTDRFTTRKSHLQGEGFSLVGSRIQVEVKPGRFEIVAATGSVTELKGLFGKRKPVSIKSMNAAIAARGSSAR